MKIQTKSFPKWKISSHKSLYRPKKQTRISLNFRREATYSQSDLKELRVKFASQIWSERTTFLTVQNTKNRSIRNSILVQIHNQTCNYLCTKKLRGWKVDFQKAASSPLDKTTICPRSFTFSKKRLAQSIFFKCSSASAVFFVSRSGQSTQT